MSQIFFVVEKIQHSGGASWWIVCYQRGLPRLVLFFYCQEDSGSVIPNMLKTNKHTDRMQNNWVVIIRQHIWQNSFLGPGGMKVG